MERGSYDTLPILLIFPSVSMDPLYSFKAVQQVVTMLNVGHFGGTGAFSLCLLACMYLLLQNVAATRFHLAFLFCIYCYMYIVSLPGGLYFSHPLIVFSTD